MQVDHQSFYCKGNGPAALCDLRRRADGVLPNLMQVRVTLFTILRGYVPNGNPASPACTQRHAGRTGNVSTARCIPATEGDPPPLQRLPDIPTIFRKMRNRNQTDTNEIANTETKYQTYFYFFPKYQDFTKFYEDRTQVTYKIPRKKQ